MGRDGGRGDSSLLRIPPELVESGLLVHYSSLPFQVCSCGICVCV